MQLQIYKNIANNVNRKIGFQKFFKKTYKIGVIKIFLTFARLIIEHFFQT